MQNGVSVRTKEKTLDDLEESFEQCVSCNCTIDTLYILRGICKESLIGKWQIFWIMIIQVYFYADTYFYSIMINGYLGFIGNQSEIRWFLLLVLLEKICCFFHLRYENDRWIAKSFKNLNFSAKSTTYSVLGSHEWTFQNDSKENLC